MVVKILFIGLLIVLIISNGSDVYPLDSTLNSSIEPIESSSISTSDNKIGCHYYPDLAKKNDKSVNLGEDSICRNSIEVMAMAAYQTGDIYQIDGKLAYSYMGDNLHFKTKGSFQEIRSSTVFRRSANGAGKLSLSGDIYPYIAMGGNLRNDGADLYYYAVGPGFRVTEGLILEIGIGQVIAKPGGKRLISRGALNFRYKFTEYWNFEEILDMVIPLGGSIRYIIDSDSILNYQLTSHSAFRMGVTYNGIDNNKHRVQMLIGINYKF